MNKNMIAILMAVTFVLTGCGNATKNAQGAGSAPNNAEVRPAEQPSSHTVSAEVPDSLPTVVDFSAVWCGPCKMFAPVFHAAEKQYAGKVNFITVDIDEHPELANQYGVQGVPTIIFLGVDGKEMNRLVGAPSKEDFIKEVDKLISQ